VLEGGFIVGSSDHRNYVVERQEKETAATRSLQLTSDWKVVSNLKSFTWTYRPDIDFPANSDGKSKTAS
jgi:hypothetical protein